MLIPLVALPMTLLYSFQSHLRTCEYREFQCTQCGQYIRYNLLEHHKLKECSMRPITCQHCKKEVPYQQMDVRSLSPKKVVVY